MEKQSVKNHWFSSCTVMNCVVLVGASKGLLYSSWHHFGSLPQECSVGITTEMKPFPHLIIISIAHWFLQSVSFKRDNYTWNHHLHTSVKTGFWTSESGARIKWNRIELQYITLALHRRDLIRDTKYSLLGRDHITRDLASIIKEREVNILRSTEKKGTAKESGLSRIYGKQGQEEYV